MVSAGSAATAPAAVSQTRLVSRMICFIEFLYLMKPQRWSVVSSGRKSTRKIICMSCGLSVLLVLRCGLAFEKIQHDVRHRFHADLEAFLVNVELRCVAFRDDASGLVAGAEAEEESGPDLAVEGKIVAAHPP